jgi:hypothetical protein
MRSERRRTFSGEHETLDTGDPQVDRCLDELGARLHRESVRLAGRYPATRPQIMAVPAPRRSLGNTAWVTALAAAAIVAIVVSPRLRDANPVGQPPGRAVVSAASAVVPEPAKVEQARDIVAPEAVPFSESVPLSPMVASHAPVSMTEPESPVFLLDVSDPELEALLDLWEEERPERTRLSI